MYNNLEGKLKILAIITMIVMTLGAIAGGIVIFAEADDEMIPVGVLIMIAGFFVGWVSSWPIYALGEIVGKVDEVGSDVEMLGKSDEQKQEIKEAKEQERQKIQEQLQFLENQYKAGSGNPLG